MKRSKQDETTLKNLWTYAWEPEPMTSTLAPAQDAKVEKQAKLAPSLLPVKDPENWLDGKGICALFKFSSSYLSSLKRKGKIWKGKHYIVPGGAYLRNAHIYNIPAMNEVPEVFASHRLFKGTESQSEPPPSINHQALKASLEAPKPAPPVVEVELVNGRYEGKAPILRNADLEKMKEHIGQLRDIEESLATLAAVLPPMTCDILNISRYSARCCLNGLYIASNPGKRFFRDERMFGHPPERQINSAS